MVTSTEILAQQIQALRDRIGRLANTPQLPNSSIDNGAITVVSSGQPTAYVGVQYDGTSGAVAVAGPTPPYPNPPTVTTTVGGVKVHWDGTFAAPQPGFTVPVVAPLDFAAVDIHVSSSPTFADDNVGFGTQRGSITSAAGGDHFVSWQVSGQQVYVRLVTRTKPGKFSPPSQTAGPTPSGQVQLGDIGFPIAQYSGGNTIYFTVSPVTPTPPAWGFTAGDMWLNQTATATGAAGGPPAGTPLYLTSQWTGSVWVLLQDQGISQSLASAIIAQSTADGKATVFTQTHVPSWSGAANSAYWINTAPGADGVTEVWDGAAFVPYQLGNGAIQPNSLIASNVVATGTVTAALMEARMVLTTTVIAGDPNSTHAAMMPDGFHVFDSTGAEVIRLGTASSNDYFGIVDGTGRLIASIDETGYASFSGVSTLQWPDIGSPDWTGNGGSLGAMLDRRPRGLVIYGETASATSTTNTSGGVGVIEVKGRIYMGRIYRIAVRCRLNATTNDCVGEVQIRYEQGGLNGISSPATPTITSTIAGRLQTDMSNGNASGTYFEKLFSYGAGNGTDYVDTRFLLSMSRPIGTGTITMFGTSPDVIEMWVEDIGPFQPNNAIANNGGGGGPIAPQNFNTSWTATWTESYKGGGSLMTNSAGQAYQGNDPSGFNGVQTSYIGFPDMTGTLSGATVTSVGVFLYANHWYFNSGGTALIGAHGFLNPPGSYGGGQLQWADSTGWPKPGGRWVSFPVSQNWVSGVWRGILLGDPAIGGNEIYYGIFDGAGYPNPPIINISYYK